MKKKKIPRTEGDKKEEILKIAQELEKCYTAFIRQCEAIQNEQNDERMLILRKKKKKK